jgi:hypothetical protein
VAGRPAARDAEQYGHLLHEVREIGERAVVMIASQGDVEGFARAIRTIDMHLRAAVVNHQRS